MFTNYQSIIYKKQNKMILKIIYLHYAPSSIHDQCTLSLTITCIIILSNLSP